MTTAPEKLVDEFERSALERYAALQRSGARITVGIAEDIRYQQARRALLTQLGAEHHDPVAARPPYETPQVRDMSQTEGTVAFAGATTAKPVCTTCRGTGIRTGALFGTSLGSCDDCNGRGWVCETQK